MFRITFWINMMAYSSTGINLGFKALATIGYSAIDPLQLETFTNFTTGPRCSNALALLTYENKQIKQLGSFLNTLHVKNQLLNHLVDLAMPHMAKKTTGRADRYFARLIRCRSRDRASGACLAVMTHCRARIKKGTDQA